MLSTAWQYLNGIAASAFWFLVVVGILVFLHEAGHFLTAKLFGMRVEVFSLGFGKRLFGSKRGDTDYRVSLIPLGGYVRLAGGDESGESGAALPPDYFLARPRWQRFLVMVMGAAVNLALAVGLYAVAFMAGVEMPVPGESVIQVVDPGTPAAAAGLRPGDRITRVAGREVADWSDVWTELVRAGRREIPLEVSRAEQSLVVHLTPVFADSGAPELGARGGQPTVVSNLDPELPAAKAGMRDGDQIESIDGITVISVTQVVDLIHGSVGKELRLGVRRGSEVIEIRVTPVLAKLPDGSERGRIGFIPRPPLEVVRLGPTAAFTRAASFSWEQAGVLFHVFKNLITRQLPFSMVSGPIGIAKESRAMAADGVRLVFWMAFISLQLGIMNLLPVPGLDGGHIFFLVTEGLLRRDLSVQIKERLTQAGVAVLIVFMAAVLFQDIWRNLRP